MLSSRSTLLPIAVAAISWVCSDTLHAADWTRFRGPNGTGVSAEDEKVPDRWSETENLKWRIELPGPGLSSPIVVGDRVFLTCWTGYGIDRQDPGQQEDLKLHLVCLDRKSGNTIWSKTIDPVLPDDEYRGMFAENGYTSHTPVSDGERVFAFFGKSGVVAFDLDGNELWRKSVGTESDPMGWGSASSPILYKDMVIITAAAESESIVALKKENGEEVWRQPAGYLSGTWGTPILVDVADDRQDLVLAIPGEIWALNPNDGKLRWYCKGIESNSMCSSVIAHDGIVYAVGGRGGGRLAVRAGGKGDVTNSHILWSEKDQGRISTPIFADGRIFWINSKTLNCIDAATGKRLYRSRLTGGTATESATDAPSAGGRRGRGGRGQDYSSPVIADGKIYYVTRSGDCYVIKAGPKFEQLAKNQFGADSGEFSATPAISNGELFVRSSKYLYCITADKSGVETNTSNE